MLACALHPLYKNFVLDPSQHGLFDARSKAAGVSSLSRLVGKVRIGAGDAACRDEPTAKKPKLSILAVDLPGYTVPQAVSTAVADEVAVWRSMEIYESGQADFWAAQYNSKTSRLKKLPHVARAVLGVPNVSSECERDFSLAKALLSPQRRSMHPETVARKMFLMGNKRLWVANPGVKLPD